MVAGCPLQDHTIDILDEVLGADAHHVLAAHQHRVLQPLPEAPGLPHCDLRRQRALLLQQVVPLSIRDQHLSARRHRVHRVRREHRAGEKASHMLEIEVKE